MRKFYFLPFTLIITCLLSCGKGGSSPSSTDNNNSNNNTSLTVSTIAGGSTDTSYPDGAGYSAGFYSPAGITVDPSGNLYVTDQNRIRKVTQAGVVTTFAGSTTASSHGYADGTGTNVLFNSVQGITSDAAGNLYVCDRDNYRIRKITPAGVVSTIAGDGASGHLDGTGTNAEFLLPTGITIDAASNLYVTDNDRIRKITPSGVVTSFTSVSSIEVVVDASGSNMFTTTLWSILKITVATDATSLLAGNSSGQMGFSDGTGATARFSNLLGIIIFDSSGDLYACDSSNSRIRKITSGGVVTTVAGTGTSAYVDGPVLSAQFKAPSALAMDASGNVFICDGQRIRKISK